MRPVTPARRALPSQAGFTLIELLIVVAIIGMLASIAVPALQNALHKSRRNAAIADLKTLKSELMKYASDNGSYPHWGTLNVSNLRPLTPRYVAQPKTLLKNLLGERIDYYISWNVYDDEYSESIWTSPQGFLLRARMAHDKDMYFYITDGTSYLYDEKHGTVTRLDELK